MKKTIIALVAIAALAGATVAAATSPRSEIEMMEALEAEIEMQVDSNLRDILSELRAGA